MDPTLTPLGITPSQEPKDLKTKIQETSNELIRDHYEGFLHRLVGIIFSVLKFLRTYTIMMIKMALGRGD